MINPRFEKEAFKKDVEQNVKQLFRKTVDEASQQELYQAVSYVVKDAIIDDWIATQKKYEMIRKSCITCLWSSCLEELLAIT